MSTRAWYEYFVIDPAAGELSRAMQFYKWGDGTPENAVAEWSLFHDILKRRDGRLPAEWVEDLLRDQLQDLYFSLPRHFALGVFLFLLQRAEEERSPFRGFEYRGLPKEERPDFRLGFAIGEAMALNRFSLRDQSDPLLDWIVGFVGTGRFVRQWKDYGARLSVLQWLQYLTQDTFREEMGSIAGAFHKPFDVGFVHRFFIWLRPSELFSVERISLELCNGDRTSVLRNAASQDSPQAGDDWKEDLARETAARLTKAGAPTDSLEQLRDRFQMSADTFWRPAERPELVGKIKAEAASSVFDV